MSQYRGTENGGIKVDYIKTGEGILLRNVSDFEPRHIFECGQCFRWNRLGNGDYRGVAMGRMLEIRMTGKDVLFAGADMGDFEKIWMDYFDLKRDYGEIKRRLSRDPVLAKAVEFGHGIRILRQDPWETLVSFIISANNNIPRIKNTIERLCSCFGKAMETDGGTCYGFPCPEDLAVLDEKDIRECGCGFRGRYIAEAARIIARGDMDIYAVEHLDTERAREYLMRFRGVGPKVADCILLFSMGKYDAFPVDVWVRRVMEYFYLRKGCSPEGIREFAGTRFGELAGFAQQYLFYYARDMMGRSLK